MVKFTQKRDYVSSDTPWNIFQVLNLSIPNYIRLYKNLGSVAVQISRPGKNDAIIYGLRGTEPGKDTTNDALTDIVLALGGSSAQSDIGFREYKSLAANKNGDYFISGHSLGSRIT